MKLAAQPYIFGASCFCLLRTVFGSASSSECKVSQNSNMSTESTATYASGSSSVAFITTPDETSAKKLARLLLDNKLCACVNIIPKITSIYVWDDKVNEDSECMMVVKTRTSRVMELTKYVRENHPYSVAEVIAMKIDQGNPPYMDWLQRSVPDAEESQKCN